MHWEKSIFEGDGGWTTEEQIEGYQFALASCQLMESEPASFLTEAGAVRCFGC